MEYTRIERDDTHMKKTRTLTSIIASILTLAILLTGSSLDGAMTANATTTVDQFKDGSTVTMKPGDVKKLLVTNPANKYKWSSSDESVATVSVEFVDDTVDYTECAEITAVSSGTTTITAEYKGTTIRYTMTVNVTLPKMTAAQKKCKKHVWKVTKKATCTRNGIKTCKKCKLQKETKKTAHKYMDCILNTEVCDSYYYIESCTTCLLDPNVKKGEAFTVKVKYLGSSVNDPNSKLAPDSEYTLKEATQLMSEHLATHGFTHLGNGLYTSASYNQTFEPCDTHDEKTEVKQCVYCGTRKNK